MVCVRFSHPVGFRPVSYRDIVRLLEKLGEIGNLSQFPFDKTSPLLVIRLGVFRSLESCSGPMAEWFSGVFRAEEAYGERCGIVFSPSVVQHHA